jgi:signal transduction histidine kinase
VNPAADVVESIAEPGESDQVHVVVGDRRPQAAWNVARTVLTVVFCTSCIVALLEVWQAYQNVPRAVVAAVLMGALLAIQLAHFSRPGVDLHSPRSYALLVVLAALAYVPLPAYQFTWLSLPPFLAGCVLLVLPPAFGWSAFTVIIGSLAWMRVLLDESPLTVVYGVQNEAFFGLIVYLLTRLASFLAETHAARDELAKGAVAEERLRFARDLHDLLGLSLSSITLKGELTHRVLTTYPERAKQELTEIVAIARRALADVRSVARGYREPSLDQAARSAVAVLQASDIDVRMDLVYSDLPITVRTILGMVLREGVTNVLRHDDTAHCEIVIRQSGGIASLTLTDDGVFDSDSDMGGAVANLSTRVAALHGTITTRVRGDGRFELHAELPLATGQPTRRRPSAFIGTLPLNARQLTLLVTLAFADLVFAGILHLAMLTSDVWTNLSGDAYLVALLVLQLAYFARPKSRLRSTQGYLMLFLQACLIYLPLLQLGENWVSLPGWLGGNALLTLPLFGGGLVFLGTIGSEIWTQVVIGAQALDVTYYAAAAVVTGAIAYGLTALMRLIADVQATRNQVAAAAVAEERLRFARDLHDLLGLSLSAITLKCELTHRLLGAAPDQAAVELAEILDLARQALADVRSVASGCRELPFDRESESAESVLTAADVAVRMDLDYDDLPVGVRTVLAVVLREGVTNVLRHSKASQCDIMLRQADDEVSLVIVNDGVTVEHASAMSATPSSGIRNLSERVAKLGGELDCGPASDDKSYRLHVSLPLRQELPAPESAALG